MNSLYAVAFVTANPVSAVVVNLALWALLVAAAGLGMLSTAARMVWRSAMARRIVVAFLIAMLLGVGTSYAAIYCCCDPWWAEWFWICIAP